MPTFYEFFAGGGMARAGLGRPWRCLFANDFDHKKGRTYRANWGDDALKVGDVGKLAPSDLPGHADLAWASFPCQDLSLAGAGAGLRGERSGTFWPFWKLLEGLVEGGRAPSVVALENVYGTLTSHGGKDFAAICAAFHRTGYRVGAMVIDAALFVPHSRPRLFVVGVRQGAHIPAHLMSAEASKQWHPPALQDAVAALPKKASEDWIWWNLKVPPARKSRFVDLVEDEPTDVEWYSKADTKRLLDMMSPLNLAKVKAAKALGRRTVGGIYKRTRRDETGVKVQRAEVRFDEISGCLRTPAGGSSRQLIMLVEGQSVRARLISARETARLMGLPESYKLPSNYNEAYHLTGDGVAVPVVSHLSTNILLPILSAKEGGRAAA